MRLAKKSFLVLTCLLTVLIIVSVSSIRTMISVESGFRAITEQTVQLIQELDQIRTLGLRINGSAAEFAILVSHGLHHGHPSRHAVVHEALMEERKELSDASKQLMEATGRYRSLVDRHYPEHVNFAAEILEEAEFLIAAANGLVAVTRDLNPQEFLLQRKESLEVAEQAFLTTTSTARDLSIAALRSAEAKAHVKVDRVTVLNWVGLAFALIFIPLIFGYFAYSIARPLRSLANASQEIARGNFDAVPIIQRGDEIGELSVAFRDMAADLNAHQSARQTAEEELKSAYGDLEKTVEIRTADLRQEIQERRRIEEDLIESKNVAETASRAKTRFLAAASHDLRQPLQAITLYLSALRELEDEQTKQNLIDKVSTSVDSVSSLLNALLDISKLDAGLVTPSRSSFSIARILTAIDDISGIGESQGVAVRVIPSTSMIESDPALLETVIRNLAANAVKYTEAGRVLIGCRHRGRELRIEIWDTGIGIPADKQHLIFEEFYQVGNFARDRAQGLGLGLSIVARISTLLGHQVEVNSIEGRGTMFAVTVPIAAEAQTIAA